MLRASRLDGPDIMRQAVACQAELVNSAVPQQTRIRRSMRRMTSRASFSFYRSMFVGERTLFVHVTFNASCVGTSGQSGLFEFKTTMRIMAINATDRAFQNLMVKGRAEIRFDLAVAAHAKLRIAGLQDSHR
jgi:hypothetical protein